MKGRKHFLWGTGMCYFAPVVMNKQDMSGFYK